MARIVSVVWIVMTLFAAPGASAAKRAIDPPRIVPWHLIGNVALGMTRLRVEYVYGDPVQEPCGLCPGPMERYVYRGRGRIGVWYSPQGRVFALDTASPVYRTPHGFGVGSKIPLGPCYRTTKTSCQHRWKGFTYRFGTVYLPSGTTKLGVWERCFVRGRDRVYVMLSMSRNAVRAIWMTTQTSC